MVLSVRHFRLNTELEVTSVRHIDWNCTSLPETDNKYWCTCKLVGSIHNIEKGHRCSGNWVRHFTSAANYVQTIHVDDRSTTDLQRVSISRTFWSHRPRQGYRVPNFIPPWSPNSRYLIWTHSFEFLSVFYFFSSNFHVIISTWPIDLYHGVAILLLFHTRASTWPNRGKRSVKQINSLVPFIMQYESALNMLSYIQGIRQRWPQCAAACPSAEPEVLYS